MKKRSDAPVLAAVLLIAAAVLIPTVPRTVQIGDSAELITAALTDSLSHPPGYSLYLMLMRVLCLPFPGAKGYLFNLFSVFFSLGGIYFLMLSILNIFKKHHLVFAVLPLIFTSPFWETSTVAEVYALYFFLLSAGLYLHIKIAAGEREFGPLFFFVSGLGLVSHQAYLFFFIPGTVILILKKFRPSLPGFLCFTLPLALCLYAPFRARYAEVYNWNFSADGNRFLDYILRRDYEPILLGLGMIGDKMRYLYLIFIAGWGVVFTVIAAAAAVFMKKASAPVRSVFILLLFSFPLIVFLVPAAFTYRKAEVFLQYFVSGVPFAAVVYAFLLSLLKKKHAMIANTLLAAALVLFSFRGMAVRDGGFYENYGIALMKDLPENAVLVVKGDNPTFITLYEKYVRRFRPDIGIYSRNDIIRQPESLKERKENEIALFQRTENIYYHSYSGIEEIDSRLVPCGPYFAKDSSKCPGTEIETPEIARGTALLNLVSTCHYFSFLRTGEMTFLEKAETTGDHNAYLFYNLGYYFSGKGEFGKSAEYYKKGYAIEKDPGMEANLYNVNVLAALKAYEKNDLGAALSYIIEAERVRSGPDILFYKGVIYDAAGDREKARYFLGKYTGVKDADPAKKKAALEILGKYR